MLEYLKCFILSLYQPRAGEIYRENLTKKDLAGMSKEELEDLGIQLFDVDIDRRRKHSHLVEKIWELIEKKLK